MSTSAAESATGVSDAEVRVLDALDDQLLVDDLVTLIRTPSVTGTDVESELQHVCAARLAELGHDVDVWQLDLTALASHPDNPGTEALRSDGWGVVGRTGPTDVPALVLQGHVDVVPTGELDNWIDRDPWAGTIAGGMIRGRGACDMKAGLAANLAVARALAVSGVTLERSFGVHAVISEEDGGLGAFATMLRGHRGEAAVITEPTTGRVVVANAGALTFELRIPGRATHGSSRHVGQSAIDAFLPVHAALADLERERNTVQDSLFADNPLPYPISIGTLRSGDWASSVPDLLVAQGRLGVILDESPDEARAALERTVADTCARDPWLREHPVIIRWVGGQFASGRIDLAEPLVGQVTDAIRDVEGRASALCAAPYGSDLRLYSGIGGIPTLHYGPGDVHCAHGPFEQVEIAEVVRVTRTLAVLAARRCGAHL